jgi:DNA-directed RNA polymerase specialized sigma subunit
VKQIACQFICRMPPQVELDDVIQAGMVSLLEAAGRYTALEDR